jgi:hypothetical protein
VLPALLVYQAGELVDTLLCLRTLLDRVTDDDSDEDDEDLRRNNENRDVSAKDCVLTASNLARYLRQMGYL